jgi:hypothetical protein
MSIIIFIVHMNPFMVSVAFSFPFFYVVDTPCHPLSMPQAPCHACEAFFFNVFNMHGAFLYLLLLSMW